MPWVGGGGGCLDMLFCKILPEAKSVFIPIYNCFFSPKTEVKRNVQKSHVLTGKKILKGNVI